MLRLNIKAAENGDGHWSPETPGAGKEPHVETGCSTPTPKPSIQTNGGNPNTQLKAPLGVGVLSEGTSP